MNNNENQNPNRGQSKHCTNSFTVEGREIKNNYLCGQTPFTSSDLWNIEKQRRLVTERS